MSVFNHCFLLKELKRIKKNKTSFILGFRYYFRIYLEFLCLGPTWCPDCRTSKQFLGEHRIPYNWVDIEEDLEGEQFVIEKNEGKRIIPTIVFAAGDVGDTSTKQVVSAVGEGSTAARLIREYLKSV